MLRPLVQTLVVLCVAGVACAQTATPSRMWYRGAFDGWEESRTTPQTGYYYQPSPTAAYPLNESAYGQPLYCAACGHAHFPGQDVCPYCGRQCPAGGNRLDSRTVYSEQRLPGAYYFKEQPHYRFVSPMRLGSAQQYTRPYD